MHSMEDYLDNSNLRTSIQVKLAQKVNRIYDENKPISHDMMFDRPLTAHLTVMWNPIWSFLETYGEIASVLVATYIIVTQIIRLFLFYSDCSDFHPSMAAPSVQSVKPSFQLRISSTENIVDAIGIKTNTRLNWRKFGSSNLTEMMEI